MRLGLLSAAVARRRQKLILGSATPDADQSSLTPDAFSVIGNGTDDVALVVEALDESGLPLAGVQAVITAEVVRASVATSDVLAAGTVAADTETTVTVTIRDANSEPVPDVAAADIGLSSTGTGNTIGAFSGRTNELGAITCTFESSVEESKTLTATIEGSNITATHTIVVGSPPAPPGGSDPDHSDTFVGPAYNDSGTFVWGYGTNVAPGNAEGSDCLVFTFGPDADLEDSRGEQRFQIGANVNEVWIEFDLFLPANYVHRTQSAGGTNNKFIRLWGDDYGAGNKVGASTFLVGGHSRIGYEYIYKTYADGLIGRGPGSDKAELVDYGAGTQTAMLDAWTQVRMHFKMPTAAENDGEFRIWYDGVLMEEYTAIPAKFDDIPYWNEGYLLGAGNSGWTDETLILIDNFKLWHTNDPGWV